MTRVSIIMPVYNSHEWLDEAVNSVFAQTHSDIELIVVDDGSTEWATAAALTRLESRGITVIHQENKGPGAARNTGIQAASGEFILPLDSDDTISPDYVARAASVLDTQSDVGIVYCKAELTGARSGLWQLPSYTLEEMLVQGLIFNTALFRRSDWECVGGYDETLTVREDHDFWLRIVGTGRSVHKLDDALFQYRVRETSRNSGHSREEFANSYAQIFRNNQDLYVAQAEYVVTHYFELVDKVNDYNNRYRQLEKIINSYPRAYGALRRVKRTLLRG